MKNERNKSGLTEVLYETNGFIFECKSTVLACEKAEKGYAIILDKTPFFPEGGGQASDVGTINDITVFDVQIDDDGRVLHYTNAPIDVGTIVNSKIDKELRLPRMQNHTAEHILSGLIYNLYGYENVGFHMSEHEVVFDTSGLLTKDQIQELENRANEIVYKNLPVTISFPTEDEARALNYRSKLDTYEDIRLVTIEDVDVCACCAPHLDTTGQIGIIKIIDYMPHRQGMRITMIAGYDALIDYKKLHDNAKEIMSTLSAKRTDIALAVNDLAIKNQTLHEENTSLKYELTRMISEQFLEKLSKRDLADSSIEVIFTDVLDNTGLRNLINNCTEQYPFIVAGFIGNDREGYKYIISTSGNGDIRALSKQLNDEFSGRGGGNAQMVQGSIIATRSKIEDYLK